MQERRKDDVIAKAIRDGFKDLSKWLAILDDTLAKGLEAIALAASTPEDNSAHIKDLTEKVRAVREKLKTSIDNQQQGE